MSEKEHKGTPDSGLDLSVHIGQLVMPNPVGVASGTFGYGEDYDELVHTDALGALYTKAVTLEARRGNPAPRLVETPMGLINSIGLANPGVDQFLQEKLPLLRRHRCAVIVNVAGSTEDDYAAVIERIESHLAAEVLGPEERRGVDGLRDQRLLCECPQRGHVLRHRSRADRTPDALPEEPHGTAAHPQAEPERDGYRGDRNAPPKRGVRTRYPASTPSSG